MIEVIYSGRARFVTVNRALGAVSRIDSSLRSALYYFQKEAILYLWGGGGGGYLSLGRDFDTYSMCFSRVGNLTCP